MNQNTNAVGGTGNSETKVELGTNGTITEDEAALVADTDGKLKELADLLKEADEIPVGTKHYPTILAGAALVPRLAGALRENHEEFLSLCRIYRDLDRATQAKMAEQNAEIETLRSKLRDKATETEGLSRDLAARDAEIEELKRKLAEARSDAARPVENPEPHKETTQPSRSRRGN